MADIVPSLFGMTPGMYQQAQQNKIDAQALQYAQLDPFQQANYAIGRGASGLAGAVGGLLGGQDPELQRITARQQIAKQINPNDPASIQQGIMALQQAGDTQGAMMLQSEYQKMQESRALTGQRQASALESGATMRKTEAEIADMERQRKAFEALLGGSAPVAPVAPVAPMPIIDPETGTISMPVRPQTAITGTDLVPPSAVGTSKTPPPQVDTTTEIKNEIRRLQARRMQLLALPKIPAAQAEAQVLVDQIKELQSELKVPAVPSVGTDRTAISLEVYNKPFDQLTTTERAVVNKRVEAEQAKRTPKVEVKNIMPGDQNLADIPAFRRSVQSTIEPQLKTITATDQALQAIDDSIASNNFISFNAARVQLAKALGDSQLSRQDIKQAGGDPSILGGLVDVVNTAFTSTPSPDTQKKIRDTLKAIQTVARRQANNEVDQQRKIALRSPGYNAEAVNEALNFPQLQGGVAPSAGGDLAAQAAAELARRKGGK